MVDRFYLLLFSVNVLYNIYIKTTRRKPFRGNNMLFDEAELLTLDQVAVKNTTDKEKLKQKPAPLIDE